MADELADQVQSGEVVNDASIPVPQDSGIESAPEKSEKLDKSAKPEKTTIRQALNKAVEQAKEDEKGRLHGKDGKFAPKDKPVVAQGAPAETPKTEKDVQPKASEVIGPPPGWSADSKAAFAALPDPVKQDILKREKEVSDGFKSKSDELKRYTEIEQVLASARPIYQQAGVRSDAEAISRLFSVEASLRNPNTRMQTFQNLAQQYGINFNSPQPQAQIPDQLRPVFDQFGQITQQVSSLQGELQRSREEKVSETLAAFSKDKPHFEKVRVRMGQLIQAGAVPPNDLDSAYQQAIWADPEIRAALIKEQTEKQAAEQIKAQQQRTQSARAAAISPGTRAPSGPIANGKATGKQSVRDALNASIKELQENRA